MIFKAIENVESYLEMLKISGLDFIQANSAVFQPTVKKETLLELKEEVGRCMKCSELARTRKSVVFGSGNARAELVFVGEAPGHDEDLQGLPFVGRAGQLLTKIIESIGLTRQSVFICNVLKCRPPGNRNPLPNEIQNCEPYLFKQIEYIQPKIICALGTFAAQTLLKTTAPISSLRGRFHEYQGAKLICTFHPAYLLRNPEDKRKTWEDMKMIRAELNNGAHRTACHSERSEESKAADHSASPQDDS